MDFYLNDPKVSSLFFSPFSTLSFFFASVIDRWLRATHEPKRVQIHFVFFFSALNFQKPKKQGQSGDNHSSEQRKYIYMDVKSSVTQINLQLYSYCLSVLLYDKHTITWSRAHSQPQTGQPSLPQTVKPQKCRNVRAITTVFPNAKN